MFANPLRIRRDIDENDVVSAGTDTRRPAVRKPLRERLGIRVVVGEPLDVVLERVKARRSENPGLPQTAAQHLAQAPRFGDQSADRRAPSQPARRVL